MLPKASVNKTAQYATALSQEQRALVMHPAAQRQGCTWITWMQWLNNCSTDQHTSEWKWYKLGSAPRFYQLRKEPNDHIVSAEVFTGSVSCSPECQGGQLDAQHSSTSPCLWQDPALHELPSLSSWRSPDQDSRQCSPVSSWDVSLCPSVGSELLTQLTNKNASQNNLDKIAEHDLMQERERALKAFITIIENAEDINHD